MPAFLFETDSNVSKALLHERKYIVLNRPADRKINVAIDGPAGAGKSTVARMVAESLGYIYVDTGAMYRTVTLKSIRENVDATDVGRLVSLSERLEIRLVPEQNGQRVHMDGEDVTEAIRSVEVTNQVSAIAAVSQIRDILVQLQRDIAGERGVVMDGRDIGTNVLPDAEVKVFMTASVRIRAERRWRELREKEPSVTVESLMAAISERDRIDSEREASPLMQAEDAILLDTSAMTIEEAADSITTLCRRALEE
jgi:cytidylate kinase